MKLVVCWILLLAMFEALSWVTAILIADRGKAVELVLAGHRERNKKKWRENFENRKMFWWIKNSKSLVKLINVRTISSF